MPSIAPLIWFMLGWCMEKSTYEFFKRTKLCTPRKDKWEGNVCGVLVRNLHLPAKMNLPLKMEKNHLQSLFLKQFKDDHAGVRWGYSIENAKGVQNWGHCCVMTREHVQLLNLKLKILQELGRQGFVQELHNHGINPGACLTSSPCCKLVKWSIRSWRKGPPFNRFMGSVKASTFK